MPQLSWRPDERLVGRVRSAAAEAGRSVNDDVSRVLDAATDPDLAGSEADRVRERLARAGVLVAVTPTRTRPDGATLAAARAAAGHGTPLADLVRDGRV